MMNEEMEEKFAKTEKDFKSLCANPKELKEATENFFYLMIDELTMEIIFETHRSTKIGVSDVDEDSCNDEEYHLNNSAEEMYRQQAVKKQHYCTCPICSRTVGASKFAPHLETCMGLGRKSSRNANRMLVSNNNKERESSYGVASDNEDDSDWNSKDKRKKKKSNNNRVKKLKTSPKKNGENATTDITYMAYDNMSEEEKKNLLTKICGVKSESTKKICSRSLRCAVHSDEKRRALRTAVICDTENSESVNVDVEGDDDIDSASLRDLLQDNSNTSSPADSASTSNGSSSSKKRDKSTKVKSKNSKKDKSPNLNSQTD